MNYIRKRKEFPEVNTFLKQTFNGQVRYIAHIAFIKPITLSGKINIEVISKLEL